MPTTGVVVGTEDTRQDLIDALEALNVEAKKLTRRGRVGTLDPRHAAIHAAMEPLVDGILFRRSLGLD